MAFMLGKHLVFLDSFQFMSSNLYKLVSNLPKDNLKYTSKQFTGKKLSLMSQKGVYPYDFMDNFEKSIHRNYQLKSSSIASYMSRVLSRIFCLGGSRS